MTNHPPRARAIVQQITFHFSELRRDLSHTRRVWIIEQMRLIPHDRGLARDAFIDAADRY